MKRFGLVLIAAAVSVFVFLGCGDGAGGGGGGGTTDETWTVSFDTDGGTPAIASIPVTKGESAGSAWPADPEKDNYDFGGWFDGTTEYESTTAITANVTLKAKWIFAGGEPVVSNDGFTVIVNEPLVEASNGDNYGTGAALNDDGSVTLDKGGAISYQFPEEADGFDTIKIEYNMTLQNGTDAKLIVKQYNTTVNYSGTGNIYPSYTTASFFTYDVSGFGDLPGFSLQINTDGNADLKYTVKITKITFTKIDNTVEDYEVDLDSLTVKNNEAWTANYQGFVITLPEYPQDFNIASYSKFTVNGKFYQSDGETEIPADWGKGQIKFITDPTGSWSGDNVLLEKSNLGMSETVNAALALSTVPGGLVVQNSNASVAFIEITEIKFHN
jgi:uncharacterized repeat protein (TIGR02543 family)